LQSDRVAALVAEIWRIRVIGSAFIAEHVARMKWVSDDRRSAILTSRPQVMQSLQVPAFAFPVADGVIHELQLRNISEIADREHRLKHCLQTGIVALTGQTIHLQEALIGTFLHLNQIWDLDGGWNFGEIKPRAKNIIMIVHCHSETPNFQAQLPAATNLGM
jgi:hypothetical protein